MKRTILSIVVGTFVCVSLLTPNLVLALCDAQECGDQYCNQINSIWGVPVYHNGADCMGKPDGSGRHQCVALFKIIEQEIFDNTVGAVGVARNIYFGSINSEDNLESYANGLTTTPLLPGYHLIYDDSRHAIGHVGTISEVKRKEGVENEWNLKIAEQNWDDGGRFDGHTLTRNPNGTYSVDNRGSYTVLGWVRNPKLEDVGRFEEGFRIDDGQSQAFTAAYNENGGYTELGSPFDNCDGQYVHDVNGYWVQDFSQDGEHLNASIVYNNNPGVKEAFVMHWGFLGVYWCFVGPDFLGPPVMNEVDGLQGFNEGWMLWMGDGVYVEVSTSGFHQFYSVEDIVNCGAGLTVEAAGGYDPDDDDTELPESSPIGPPPLGPAMAQVCSDIQEEPTVCLGETSYFTVTDSDVCVHLLAKFENVYDPMHLRWELFGGYAYSDTTDVWIPDPGQPGWYYPEYYVWLRQCFPGRCTNCLSYNGPWSVHLKTDFTGSWQNLATYYFELDYLGCPASDCQIGMHLPALIFTDEPIQRKVTPIKAVHMTELRDYIDLLRIDYGLSQYYWTDDPIVRKVTPIRTIHWKELRWAIEGVYQQMGVPGPYWQESINVDAPVKAQHLTEIREALWVVW